MSPSATLWRALRPWSTPQASRKASQSATASRIFLPFLYHTSTIRRAQAWPEQTQARAHNTSALKSRNDASIPFEHDLLHGDLYKNDGTNSSTDHGSDIDAKVETTDAETTSIPRDSTITDSERATFRRLFDMALGSSGQQAPGQAATGQASVEDPAETMPKDRQPSKRGSDLSTILSEAAEEAEKQPTPSKRARARQPNSARDFTRAFPQSLRSMAEVAGNIIYERQQRLKGSAEQMDNRQVLAQATEEETRLKQLEAQEATRIKALLRSAKTDMQLWTILEDEFFSAIRKLDLDNGFNSPSTKHRPRNKESGSRNAHTSNLGLLQKTGSAQEKSKASTTDSTTELSKMDTAELKDLAIISSIYPSCLVFAVQQLRHDFPGSQLALSILPTIKALGRASYALGASTFLYNELIRITWESFGEGSFVIELLADMDSGGIDFDSDTLDVVSSVCDEQTHAASGHAGASAQVIASLERSKKATGKLQWWRGRITKRLKDEALRLAKEKASREAEERMRKDIEERLDTERSTEGTNDNVVY